MIHLERVTFAYQHQTLLFDQLNLLLQAGHIYGLLGKNGAGKSSLLRLIAGLLYPQKGTLRVDGFEPRKRQPKFLQSLFFLPEEIYLPSLTIEKFWTTLSPFYPLFNSEQFFYYLKEFDISHQQHLNALSFGQKKKVLIAFALATNTKVLIMDEPTNGLDITSKGQFRKLVASALTEDRVVLISTHQVRDLDHLIDAVIILDNHEILLNQRLEHISEQLQFGTLTDAEDDRRVLYAEPSLKGYTVVMENAEKVESKVDLERLFHAAIHNPDRIRQLFPQQS